MSDERDDGPRQRHDGVADEGEDRRSWGSAAGDPIRQEDDAAMDADGFVEEVGDDEGLDEDEGLPPEQVADEPAVSAKPPPLPPKKQGPSKGLLIGGSIGVVVVGVGLAVAASELLVSEAETPPEHSAGAGEPGEGETGGEGETADEQAQQAADEAEAAAAEDREPVRLEALVVGADGGVDGGGP